MPERMIQETVDTLLGIAASLEVAILARSRQGLTPVGELNKVDLHSIKKHVPAQRTPPSTDVRADAS